MSEWGVVSPGSRFTMSASSTVEPRNGFAFLTNVTGIVGASELELIPGHTLRKATADEITAIKQILVEHNGSTARQNFFPWEMKSVGLGAYETVPEEDWAYFVISFSGSNEGANRLEQAFVLLDRGPRIGFTIMNWGTRGGTALHAGRLFQSLEENTMAMMANRTGGQIFKVDERDVDHIRELVKQMSEHPANVIDIVRVSQQLQSLEALDANSDVAFLGYFSVLESLLVHKPEPNDPTASITRQVKKKITLLNNRWTSRVDYSTFGDQKAEAIWRKMYELRSAIAHGDVPDFTQALKCLKDRAEARSLLVRTVKSVARYALKEPQLVADLREC